MREISLHRTAGPDVTGDIAGLALALASLVAAHAVDAKTTGTLGCACAGHADGLAPNVDTSRTVFVRRAILIARAIT